MLVATTTSTSTLPGSTFKRENTHFAHASPLEGIPHDWLLSQLQCQGPAMLLNTNPISHMHTNQLHAISILSNAKQTDIQKPFTDVIKNPNSTSKNQSCSIKQHSSIWKMHLGYQQSSAGLFQWPSECMCEVSIMLPGLV
jgi:hypothetical protein